MTGSVFSGMLTHFAFNATGVMMDYFMTAYPQINSVGFMLLLASMGAVVVAFAVLGTYNQKEARFMGDNFVQRNWASFFNIPVLLLVAGYVFGGLL